MREGFVIGGQTVAPGERAVVDLVLPRLSSHTRLTMPVQVVHGRRPGPRLFLCAAIHGDELNGVDIVRRVLRDKVLARLRGTLVAVPVVNVYGLIHETRYLPDRRDLNRSFPGSKTGSLAARLAHLFMTEVVRRCTHGVDLHTGAMHRTNLPQVRADLDDPETERLARAFGVPVLLNASLRDGSLRQAAADAGIPMLLYEAGEALRFDEVAIRAGHRGLLNVMRALGMLPTRTARRRSRPEPFVARSSSWTRAPESGMLRATTALGAKVSKGEVLGYVDDPYTGAASEVLAPSEGVVIGRALMPLVHEGEALFHIARFRAEADAVVEHVETFQQANEDDRVRGEPPIV